MTPYLSDPDVLEPYFRRLSRFFFVPGMDRDDLEQEARIAAWLASPGSERIAARRRILDLIRFSQRRPRFATLNDEHIAPGELVDIIEARERLRRVLAVKSPSQRRALGRCLRGEPIRRHEKAAQFALHAARRSLFAMEGA